jgi:hypothetical protein
MTKLNSSEIEGWDLQQKKTSRITLGQTTSKIDITESNQDKKTIFIPHCIIPWCSPICRLMVNTRKR